MTAVDAPEARELTKEEEDQRAELCFSLETEIKQNIAQGRAAMWDLARNLYDFNEASGWSALGYENQTEWLAQPEIGMTRTQFFRLVRKWRELVVYREIPQDTLLELEPSKVDIVLPAIEGGKTSVQDAIEDVRTLGARDLRERYIKHPEPPAKDRGDDNDDVIEGNAVEVDDAPQKASEVGVSKEEKELRYAIGMVDSWFEIGGDRRKAKRQWPKVLEQHPFFQAVTTIGAAVEGGDDAPDRLEAARAWALVRTTLGLEGPPIE